MGQPHKHAKILRAIADGKDVQWQSKLDQSWNDPSGEINPIIDSDVDWRIKPEPKPDVVQYINAYPADSGCSYDELHQAIAGCGEGAIGQVKLVIDGETGKLKSAEVV